MTREQRRAQKERERFIARVQTIIAFIVIVIMLNIAGYVATTYTREATVNTVIEHTHAVVLEDKQEHTWIVYTEDLVEGQKVKMIMGTNGTDGFIEDDYVKRIKPVEIVLK